MFDGPGHMVTIDKSIVAKRKLDNRQGQLILKHWVFSHVYHTTSEFFMELVPRCDAAMLIPLIQLHIRAGTMIRSDQWPAYHGLNRLGYCHQTVNHMQHYVNPATGVHANK